MRLSEAMRLGAMLRPQGFGNLYVAMADGQLASCAMGAADEAIDGPADEPSGENDPPGKVYEVYRALLDRPMRCPIRGCHWLQTTRTLDVVIEHLNDFHTWPRERIADWVETVEPAGDREAALQAEPFVRS